MNTYSQIFTYIGASSFICLVIYLKAMGCKNGSTGALVWSAMWLVSLIGLIVVAGTGVVSFLALMGRDSVSMMSDFHNNVSSQYDYQGLARLGSLYDDAARGNQSVKDMLGIDMLGVFSGLFSCSFLIKPVSRLFAKPGIPMSPTV